jgi:hypothetical protein
MPSARPQRAKSRGVPLGYIEAVSDARTKLRAFFNIRLDIEASEEELAQMPHPLP